MTTKAPPFFHGIGGLAMRSGALRPPPRSLAEDPPRGFCRTKPARWGEAARFIAGTNPAVLDRLWQIKPYRSGLVVLGKRGRIRIMGLSCPSVLNIPG
jgi:hypothetical protein